MEPIERKPAHQPVRTTPCTCKGTDRQSRCPAHPPRVRVDFVDPYELP